MDHSFYFRGLMPFKYEIVTILFLVFSQAVFAQDSEYSGSSSSSTGSVDF